MLFLLARKWLRVGFPASRGSFPGVRWREKRDLCHESKKVIWKRRSLVRQLQHGCRWEHSRQEDESNRTSGVVNNVHQSFDESHNHNYTRQKWISSATYHFGVGPQKWKQYKKLQQDRRKHRNKHGGQPNGCNWQQIIRHCGFSVWSKQTWPKWGAWIAYKFPRRIYFERLERSNSQLLQPKHKAV